ncbi:MAG: rhodanese-like domain-containing protein [Actinomycetota bacterium]
MDTLVTTDWLEAELGADDLVVLDCTIFLRMGEDGYISESGLANYEEGHITGAGFADLNEDLVDTSGPYRYVIPTPEHFGAAMERLGVSDTSRVVLYDDNSSMWAARVWWMLRWIGFDRAALLDGGMKAWRAEGRALQAGASNPAPAESGSLSLSPRPRLIADMDEVMAAMEDGATCLIDSLPAPVFNGDVQPYARPGHIPGAVNIPATSMVDPETGRFRPADEIEAMLPDRPEARTVAY